MKWTTIEMYEMLHQPEEVLRSGIGEVFMPKIAEFPTYMAELVDCRKFYVPQFISFFPYMRKHTTKPADGDEYRVRWTAMYLQQTSQTFGCLIERIAAHLDELMQLFTGYSPLTDERKKLLFTQGFVVSGCSLLQVLDKSVDSDSQEELKVSIDGLVQVHQDMLILGNQIPYKLLKLLCGDDNARLKRCMRNFLQIHGIVEAREVSAEHSHSVTVEDDKDEEEPFHLLDYLRRALLARDRDQIIIPKRRRSLRLRKYRIGTIRELKAAGIRIRKRKDTSFYPNFINGQLELPEIIVDGSTALIFFNLIAYEMCPDFRNNYEISSYVVFLSSLIDKPEDVKELRHAGILRNELASDKQVADLFNQMDFLLVPETPIFAHIRDQIENHFKSRRGRIRVLRWITEAYNNYLRSPWKFIALLAATLALVLTFIQTWYTIHPKGG